MPEPMTEQVAVAELNIPESVAEAACDCEALVVEVEETYFDRAIRALAARVTRKRSNISRRTVMQMR